MTLELVMAKATMSIPSACEGPIHVMTLEGGAR